MVVRARSGALPLVHQPAIDALAVEGRAFPGRGLADRGLALHGMKVHDIRVVIPGHGLLLARGKPYRANNHAVWPALPPSAVDPLRNGADNLRPFAPASPRSH